MSRESGPTQAMFAAILETLSEIVLVVDRERVMHFLNRVEPGYVLADVVGRSSDTVIPPESRAAFQKAIDTVLETGRPADYQVTVTAPDGSIQWYVSQLLPLPARSWGEGRVLVVARNDTERRNAVEQAARLKQLLPVCSWCDRIRNEEGGWERLEIFLGRSTGTNVTHGLCEDCEARWEEGAVGP